jgi:histone H1/5
VGIKPVGRGRRPLPEIRKSRQVLARAQRDVAHRTKAVHAAALALDRAKDKAVTRTSGSKSAVKFKAALIKATRLLNSAKSFEVQASQRLAKVIASEAAKVSAEVQARAIALFKEKQEKKSEADLRKAVAGFISGWTQKRRKTDLKRLAKASRKAAIKAAVARRKANAKAKAAVLKAAALAEARARKASAKARAKAVKLEAKDQAQTRLAVKKAAKKAQLAEVIVRKAAAKAVNKTKANKAGGKIDTMKKAAKAAKKKVAKKAPAKKAPAKKKAATKKKAALKKKK